MPNERVDGVIYDKESVLSIRNEMIVLRVRVLEDDDFQASVILSWAIAYLADYANLHEILESKPQSNG